MRNLTYALACLPCLLGCSHTPPVLVPVETRSDPPIRLLYDCPIDSYSNLGEQFMALRNALECEQDHNKELREWVNE